MTFLSSAVENHTSSLQYPETKPNSQEPPSGSCAFIYHTVLSAAALMLFLRRGSCPIFLQLNKRQTLHEHFDLHFANTLHKHAEA